MNQNDMDDTTHPDILHIEACNFIDRPMGGQLNFSRQLLKAFGSRLALVGWTNVLSDPVGCWFRKSIDGTRYDFFAIGRNRVKGMKPFMPERLATWLRIKRYQRLIFSLGVQNIIIQEHAVLMALNVRKGHHLCYYFPGVDSPLSISRYSWAKNFSRLFDAMFYKSLARKAHVILAAADETAIMIMKRKAEASLGNREIISFPTRVDTDVFYPGDRHKARKELGLPEGAPIAVSSGRIHWAKGWSFLVDSFLLFSKQFPGSYLIFLGDGDDKKLLAEKVRIAGLEANVIIAGHNPPEKVATYLRASDMLVMGSVKEGWSTVLVEALACGIPIVTTRFSSADTIVRQGVNGFVVGRDPVDFSKAMVEALKLPDMAFNVDSVIDRYALKNLAHDLLVMWPLD